LLLEALKKQGRRLITALLTSLHCKGHLRNPVRSCRWWGKLSSVPKKHQERPSALEPGRTAVAIKIQYKGEERTTKLSLTEEMIVTLALEAQLRHMTIGEFITEIIVATLKKDLLQVVLAPPTVPGE
jgi:hypothetical protein